MILIKLFSLCDLLLLFCFLQLDFFCEEHQHDVEDGDGDHRNHQHAVICSEESRSAKEDDARHVAHEHEQAFRGSLRSRIAGFCGKGQGQRRAAYDEETVERRGDSQAAKAFHGEEEGEAHAADDVDDDHIRQPPVLLILIGNQRYDQAADDADAQDDNADDAYLRCVNPFICQVAQNRFDHGKEGVKYAEHAEKH